MEGWIEDEFFTVKIPVKKMNEMKAKVEKWKSNGWYEFEGSGPQTIEATLHISFAFNEEQVKIEGDEATIRVEGKGTIDIDDAILRRLFIQKGGE